MSDDAWPRLQAVTEDEVTAAAAVVASSRGRGPGARPHAGRLPGPRRAAAPGRRAVDGASWPPGRRRCRGRAPCSWSRRTGRRRRSRSARPRPACRSSTTSTAFRTSTTRRGTRRRRLPSWRDRVADLAGGERRSRTSRAAAWTTARTCRWSPCIPDADVPVLQLSLPTLDPGRLLELGERLRPLRDEGVLIIGSGFMTHGLPYLREFVLDAPPPDWSKDFDQWVAAALEAPRRGCAGRDSATCRPRGTPIRRSSTSPRSSSRWARPRRRPHGHADLRLLAGALQALRVSSPDRAAPAQARARPVLSSAP